MKKCVNCDYQIQYTRMKLSSFMDKSYYQRYYIFISFRLKKKLKKPKILINK